MEHIFAYLHTVNSFWLYSALIVGILFEGEITLIFSGILVRNRVIHYGDILFFAFIATTVHDIVYWYLGNIIRDWKKEKVLGISKVKIEKFFNHLHKKNGSLIIASKFAWGMNRFVLLANGYFRTNFKKFIKYSIISTISWSVSLITLGYIFAEQTHVLRKDLRLFAITLTIFILILIFIEHRIRKVINKEAGIKEEDIS